MPARRPLRSGQRRAAAMGPPGRRASARAWRHSPQRVPSEITRRSRFTRGGVTPQGSGAGVTPQGSSRACNVQVRLDGKAKSNSRRNAENRAPRSSVLGETGAQKDEARLRRMVSRRKRQDMKESIGAASKKSDTMVPAGRRPSTRGLRGRHLREQAPDAARMHGPGGRSSRLEAVRPEQKTL